MRDKLLFVCHKGLVGKKSKGVVIEGYCLPIATASKGTEHGIDALWYCTNDVEEFFEELAIYDLRQDDVGDPPNGLWVYEVEYDDVEYDDIDWEHLTRGTLRRPTEQEVVCLCKGKAPWENGLLL